jgi:hypothetical protein
MPSTETTTKTITQRESRNHAINSKNTRAANQAARDQEKTTKVSRPSKQRIAKHSLVHEVFRKEATMKMKTDTAMVPNELMSSYGD